MAHVVCTTYMLHIYTVTQLATYTVITIYYGTIGILVYYLLQVAETIIKLF